MPTLAEMAVEREVRDAPMVALIKAGRTIRQVAEELNLNPNTVRHRATARGLTADASQARTVAPTRPETIRRPCSCTTNRWGCRAHPNAGHRFGADLTCECGTSWFVMQKHPVECPSAKRPECASYTCAVEPQPPREFCSRGHPWTDVYTNPNGKQHCRVCRKADQAIATQRRREKNKPTMGSRPGTFSRDCDGEANRKQSQERRESLIRRSFPSREHT